MSSHNTTRPAAGPPVSLTLTPEQAATLIGIKEWRVRELIRSGKLPGVRTGGTAKHPRGMRTTEEAVIAYRDSLPTYPQRELA